MLRMDVTVHESDNGIPDTLEYEELRTPLILSRMLGILSLLVACSPALLSLLQLDVCCSGSVAHCVLGL
jgi:hypothetical protein